FFDSCIINDEVIKAIKKCIPLGPLHNPANLMGIEACQAVMPTTPQVAVFDTAFHMTMPAKAYRYAIPTEYYENDSIRRYGFHGTSHKYVAKRAISSTAARQSPNAPPRALPICIGPVGLAETNSTLIFLPLP
ncbi:MAG: hypothetical protein IKU66_02130, partial [Clostridia bacterium]|nr:hypothetical protein [Clostridia bacterium]